MVLILTAVGLAGAIGITLLLATVITPSFDGLETRVIEGQIDRTRDVLAASGAEVEGAARDWADRDIGKGAARSGNLQGGDDLSRRPTSSLAAEGTAYVTPDGMVAAARWVNPLTGAEVPGLQRQLRVLAAGDLSPVLRRGNSGHFFARLGSSVAAIGVAQVRRSDVTAPTPGLVLTAREVTSAQLSQLLRRPAELDVHHVSEREGVELDRTSVRIAVPIIGADGRAVASARLRMPRDVSMLGRRMLLLAVAGSTLLLLVVLAVLRIAMARLVLKPLAHIERHMQQVRESGQPSTLREVSRRDEIGSLEVSLNAMLLQLQDLREQIEIQGFALGRSESAVAVMHNVRNALNPISTILSRGMAQRGRVDRVTLGRAIGELARDDTPLARRQKLAAFVAAATEADAEAREAMRGELQVGREAMALVLEIIGEQQKQAHERATLERCNVSQIVARNVTIARYSQLASIAFSFPAMQYDVMASRVILSQVMGNLFGNAAEAIAATGRGSGSISVSVSKDGDMVDICIRDDGEGFGSITAAALFQRGFSTREHKSGGLGLHWCANVVTAMGGALRLESEGVGRGATAILTLPAAPEASLAKAA
ncbi:signal transduction histidine kinase [Sphingomonas aerophila]|uniref:histidine kinase n=1 Tax=Sphingomonas aerophila TaxID=1344948 RepID=A0A7W9BC65_9SPHN|nr:signal transduction histidine kinase [Sphingomonas aerophila]